MVIGSKMRPSLISLREVARAGGRERFEFGAHRAEAFMRVGTIHAGAADLASATSIQPDRRVMTIGASSERRVEGRVLTPTIWCIVVVVEFVMAFSFLNQIVQVWFADS
jgi:hypothetical protein